MPHKHLALLFVVLLTLVACSSTNQTEDVSGVWKGEASNEYVSLPIELEIEQNGGSLTGTVTWADAFQEDLRGQIVGKQTTFSFAYSFEEDNGTIVLNVRYSFTGTVDENVMSGSFIVSGEGLSPVEGTFEVTREP